MDTSTQRHGSPASSSFSYTSTSYKTGASTYPRTSRSASGKTRNARPKTGTSTIAGIETQQIVCAISESRGVSPTVGLAFVNMDTCEAVLCQISDSQTYVRTIHKLKVYEPSELLIVNTSANPKSKLFSIIEENISMLACRMTLIDRKYWAESTGFDYIQQLAFAEDVEALKVSLDGNYFAVCCIAAVLKYVELEHCKSFPFRSLRIKYEPSEGSMMIDLSTIQALELVQNLQNPKSRDCLFGHLNETLTPMGSRLLKSNMLQPLTDLDTLRIRGDALEELTEREDVFFGVRDALKGFLDADRILTALIFVPTKPSYPLTEQTINYIIMLKRLVGSISPVYQALTGVRSEMLQNIHQLCSPENVDPVISLINSAINEDTTFANQPLDLRNQRTYAVKSGVNGLLDVARQTYKEASEDAFKHVSDTSAEHDLSLDMRYENNRQFYIRLSAADLEGNQLPPCFINVMRKKAWVECQTLDLMKLNQKIANSHVEVMLMSDKVIKELVEKIREHVPVLFRVCEGIAMLDMLAAFAHLATSADYTRPRFAETLALKRSRHPIREKIQSTKFIPNDVYASQQHRFQIVTGCNMSGKSTYIRSIALITVMAQIGSFVPASHATMPIVHQLFARISTDNSMESNVSTFAAEMREMAFILRNIDRKSLVIIDELGRGTSSRDALSICVAVSEALIASRSLIWFSTHFRDLATIMAERSGVINLHLSVDISTEHDSITMLYKVDEGSAEEEHYGLSLARIVPLPSAVLSHATRVAETLDAQMQQRRRPDNTVLRERRKRLILCLKEHLTQAQHGSMTEEGLTQWLKNLQKEFVAMMNETSEDNTDLEQDYAGTVSVSSPRILEQEDTMDLDTEEGGASSRTASAQSHLSPSELARDSQLH